MRTFLPSQYLGKGVHQQVRIPQQGEDVHSQPALAAGQGRLPVQCDSDSSTPYSCTSQQDPEGLGSGG